MVSAFLYWLRNRDSNPNKQSQSLSCYRYTIPQWIVNIVYYITFFAFVKSKMCKTKVKYSYFKKILAFLILLC